MHYISEYPDIFLPIYLIFVAFFMELGIGRQFTGRAFIRALFALPRDLFLLSISFFIAGAFLPTIESPIGFSLVMLGIISVMLSSLLSRVSESYYDENKILCSLSVSFFNHVISISLLIYSITYYLHKSNELGLKLA